jgi:hypothetical protein
VHPQILNCAIHATFAAHFTISFFFPYLTRRRRSSLLTRISLLRAQGREPYAYTQAAADPPYYNGNYTSPVASTFPPRSPLSHSHPLPAAGSISPPSRPPHMTSPNLRHPASPNMNAAANGGPAPPSAMAHPGRPESAGPSPLKAPMTVGRIKPTHAATYAN